MRRRESDVKGRWGLVFTGQQRPPGTGIVPRAGKRNGVGKRDRGTAEGRWMTEGQRGLGRGRGR